MKTIIPVGILLVSVCFGADTSDITTKVTEIDRDKDGVPEVRTERTFRAKNEILQIIQSTKKQGLRTTTRGYSVGGDLLMIESDEDGDAFFEMIAIHHPTKNEAEVFMRQRDGSVRPVSTKDLEAYRKQKAAIADFWDKAFQKQLSDDEYLDLMRETRKKIVDAERGKTQEKK